MLDEDVTGRGVRLKPGAAAVDSSFLCVGRTLHQLNEQVVPLTSLNEVIVIYCLQCPKTSSTKALGLNKVTHEINTGT